MSDSTPSAAPAATPADSLPLSLSLDALKAVADLLGGGEVVAYRPVFAHVFGGATPALLLSQFWFWTNTPTVKTRDGDGWFWKSQKEITQETGLTRYETDTARRKLVALGVLSEDLRGVPATQHYRLDKDRLYQLLWAHLQAQLPAQTERESQFVENHQTGLRETTKLVRGKPSNKLVGNRQTITEITPETTSKKTQRRAQPILPSASREKISEKSPEKTPDPLDALPAADYAQLETQARAQLLAETRPPVSVSLLQGKSHRLVQQRMRELLAAGPPGTPNRIARPECSASKK